MAVNKNEVFIKKGAPRKGDSGHYPIGILLRRRKTVGEVGLEIECEASNHLPKPPGYGSTPIPLPGTSFWSACKDGSLRGYDSCEYVLTKPIKFTEVDTAVKELFTQFEKKGTILDDSNRTSVHVHLNTQPFHLNRLTAFMGLYFSVEEMLTQWCGEHRVGNLFCLRGRDAPSIVTQIKKWIQSDGSYELSQNLHYAGLNAHALQKFGSLEVRTLRGCTDPAVIVNWVKMLERIYTLSKEYPDPRHLCDGFSGNGPLAFLDFVLGDMVPILRSEISWTDQRVAESMYDGIHLAQDLCYCRDWAEYRPAEVSEDPFGRLTKPKKAGLGASLATYNDIMAEAQYIHTQNTGMYHPAPAVPTGAFAQWATDNGIAPSAPSPFPSAPEEAGELDDDYEPEEPDFDEMEDDDDDF